MTFEREWLYLDELVALLGPSPDIAVVEFRFRCALDEGVLQDRNGTPAHVWHARIEADTVINFASGMMFIPWFDRDRPERTVMQARPQFHRAAWLKLFSDLLPGATQNTVTPQDAQAVERWYGDKYVSDWLLRYKADPELKPPTEADDVEAARKEFPSIKGLRALVRPARAKHAPDEWRQPGPRRRRKTPAPNLA
jgi:hypothetical protein